MSTADGYPTTLITPTTYSKPVVATDPISAAVRAAQPGDLLLLSAGNFRRCGPFPSSRPIGGPPVLIQGAAGGASTILRDTSVGGTDSIYLGPGDHDTYWKGLSIQADDRAAIKTPSKVGPNHTFENINIYGFGGPWDPNWTDDSLWGIHTYDVANWTEMNVNVWSIFKEHSRYHHNRKGWLSIIGGTAGNCGRTAYQDVARMSEGAAAVGDVTIQNFYAQDVCLEQGGGGSALTFMGGAPGVNVRIDNSYVTLGGQASLASPFNQNITGSFLMRSAPESAPGKGDGAWPGSYKSLTITGTTFEVGLVHHGSGSAVRSNVKVSDVESFFCEHTKVVTYRDASDRAVSFEFGANVGSVKFGAGMTVVGGVVWSDGTYFPDFASFKATHAELFA